MEEEDLTYQQLKNLLQDALQVFQNSGSNLKKDDLAILESVVVYWSGDLMSFSFHFLLNLTYDF